MFCDPNRDIWCMAKSLDVIDHVWLIVPSAFETLSLILICVPLDNEAEEIIKWVLHRAASVHTHKNLYLLVICNIHLNIDRESFASISYIDFLRMPLLRNLSDPAADDEVELLAIGDGYLSIQYQLRSHCCKYRLLVLAVVFLFLAPVIFAVTFTLVKKSNSEGMWH